MGQADIWAPVLYVSLLIGCLAIFSHFYRKRAAARPQFEPWYPEHPERDLYISLLQKQAPDTLLKAALLRRAAADVARIVRIREDKQALQVLVQKGSVGDDLWNSCLAAEKELEAEILEVMHEANTFRQGWGQIIFGSASEVMHHDKIKEALSKMPQLRKDAEAKFGIKKLSSTASMPPPNAPLSSVVAATSSTPTPSSPPKVQIPSTLSPSTTNGSARLSDNESATSIATGQTTSRKSSGKKGRKRK